MCSGAQLEWLPAKRACGGPWVLGHQAAGAMLQACQLFANVHFPLCLLVCATRIARGPWANACPHAQPERLARPMGQPEA